MSASERTASLAFAALLASNYLIQGVREGLITNTQGPVLLASSALCSLVSGYALSARPFRRYPEALRVSFVLALWSAALLWYSHQLFREQASFDSSTFFVVSSVATLLCASFLWGLMNNRGLNLRSSFRQFSLAAAAGQALGSAGGWLAVHFLGDAAGPYILLVASFLMSIASQCVSRLAGNIKEETPEESIESLNGYEQPVYIAQIALFQCLNCLAQSLVQLRRLDAFAVFSKSDASKLNSNMNLISAIVIVIVLLAKPLSFASPGSLMLLPIVTSLGLMTSLFFPENVEIYITCGMSVANRVLTYALTKPSREALFGGLSETDRLRSKPLVDSVACKLGGAAASPIFIASKEAPVILVACLTAWNLFSFGMVQEYRHRIKVR